MQLLDAVLHPTSAADDISHNRKDSILDGADCSPWFAAFGKSLRLAGPIMAHYRPRPRARRVHHLIHRQVHRSFVSTRRALGYPRSARHNKLCLLPKGSLFSPSTPSGPTLLASIHLLLLVAAPIIASAGCYGIDPQARFRATPPFEKVPSVIGGAVAPPVARKKLRAILGALIFSELLSALSLESALKEPPCASRFW